MKKLKPKSHIGIRLSLILLGLCLASPALAQEKEDKDASAGKSTARGAPARGERSIRSSVNAKVTDIDREKRQITLKGKEGKEKTLTVDKSVERFNEIQVGDEVRAEYYASRAGEIREATAEEKSTPLTDITLGTKADKDSPPAAGAARRVTAV